MMNFIKKAKILRYLIITGLLGLLGTLCFAFVILYYFGIDLPNYIALQNYKPDITTRLYSCNGDLFAEYANEKRVFVPIKNIPLILQNAFIAAEDKNFNSHFGIDVLGIIKAILKNIERITKRQRLIGASTITQQVARNFLLEKNARKLSFQRKIQESILAFRIEKVLKKSKILELYLNKIFLGKQAYGVAAASLSYFNKGLDELTLAECAMLASLPKAPSRYYKNKRLAKIRRNWVLQRMYKLGFISHKQMITSQNQEIVYRNRKVQNVVEDGYFAEAVRQKLLENFGKDVLYKDGLVVRCTMSSKLQKIATRALRNNLIAYDMRHGWRGSLLNVIPENDTNKSFDFLDFSILNTQKSNLFNKICQKFFNYAKPKAALPNWQLALVIKVDKDRAFILLKENKGSILRHKFVISNLTVIKLKNVLWAKKYISEDEVGDKIEKMSQVLSVGDVILVENKNSKILDSKTNNPAYLLRQIPKVSGAIIVMNAQDGKILAMSGGFNYHSSQFNRAFHAKRQVGSVIKPLICLKAFEMTDIMPTTLINDDPISIPLAPGMAPWQPKNNSGRTYGNITFRKLLANSHNIAFVRLVYEKLGLRNAAEVVKRFGVYDHAPRLYSFLLGAFESTLLRITSAYASVLNNGLKITPTVIERIQDRNGNPILINDNNSIKNAQQEWHKSINLRDIPIIHSNTVRLTSKINAYQTISMMEGVAKYGTAYRSYRKLKRVFAGKTGGTNDHRSVWFVGLLSNPKWVVATYIGFDNAILKLGEKEGASRAALPVFTSFVKEALVDVPSRPFLVPKGINFFQVRYDNGYLATQADKLNTKVLVIEDSFKRGQEPKQQQSQGLDFIH